MKEPLLQLRYSASLKAEKYDQWSANAATAAAALRPQQRDVSTNAFQACALLKSPSRFQFAGLIVSPHVSLFSFQYAGTIVPPHVAPAGSPFISCSSSYDSFLLPSLQALPADFRPVVLTAEGRSATGQCFDVPYYKQARTCTIRSLIFLELELLPVKCSRVAPSHDWSVSRRALQHTCRPSRWLHAVAMLAMAVWAVMTDKRPALCCSAATTMLPRFICIKNPADI